MHLVLGKACIHIFILVLVLAPFGFVPEKQELYFLRERNSEKNRIDVLLFMRPILTNFERHSYVEFLHVGIIS